MSKAIDLREGGGDHDLLTSLSVDGLLGSGKLLADKPLQTYLEGNEQPKYILRNKSAGLRIRGGDGERRLEPTDDYQATALITDVRVWFVAGSENGDMSAQIPLSEVVEARAETNRIRKNRLNIETLDGETWSFPCSGDTTEPADLVDDLCQVWANAERLVEEVDGQVQAAQRALEDGNYEGARGEIDGARTKLERATDRIREAGPGATDILRQKAHTTADWLTDLFRELRAQQGAQCHAQAQRDWDREAYERAADAYERAIECYESALETAGEVPEDGVLEKRLRNAAREREILRVGPIIDADTARREAATITDPEKAASVWEAALDGYREMLGLDWGRDERTFIVNRDRIRKQTTEIADDAILDYHEAGKQWLTSGDKLAVRDQDRQATTVYERAKNQFEQALALAREVKPEHVDDVETALDTVERRLAGEFPDEVPDEEPLAAAAISGLENHTEAETPDSTGETESEDAIGSHQPQETHTKAGRTTESEQERAQQAEPATTQSTTGTQQEPADASIEAGASDTATELEQGQAVSEQSDTAGSADESQTTDSQTTDADDGSIIGQIQSQKMAAESDTGNEPTDEREKLSIDEYEDADLREMLNSLDESQFCSLVADLWEAQGWSTTVFSADAESVYDVVAMRTEPVEERLLVWVAHRRDGGSVETTTVKRCATARESSRGADSATLVTTGVPTAAAATRAEELDVAIVDTEELVRLLQFEGLVDRLATLAASA